MQRGAVFEEVRKRLPAGVLDEAILTEWADLFRTGLLAWGLNLMSPDPPFFHIAQRGHQALANIARDHANPAAYLRHMRSVGKLPDVAASYLQESLECYVSDLFKASAVMVGCAAESVILTLRDDTVAKLAALSVPVPKTGRTGKSKPSLTAFMIFFAVT